MKTNLPEKIAEAIFRRAGASDERASKLLADEVIDYARKRNLMHLIPIIARKVKALSVAEERDRTVRIISPFEPSAAMKNAARTRVGAPEHAKIETLIDHSLLGGIRIEYSGRIVDASARRSLNTLENELLGQ